MKDFPISAKIIGGFFLFVLSQCHAPAAAFLPQVRLTTKGAPNCSRNVSSEPTTLHLSDENSAHENMVSKILPETFVLNNKDNLNGDLTDRFKYKVSRDLTRRKQVRSDLRKSTLLRLC